jgi:poly-gamma-glutamate synthesis protein (capsule biosynthesis protein)
VDRLVAAVEAARADTDTLVVFLHWGTEKQTCPNQAQLDLAPRLVAAGAGVVVGSHAHRVLGGGYLGGAYVDYGLGNFVFYSGGSGAGAETGVLTLTATGRQISDPVWHPARIGSDDLPRLLTGDAAAAASAKWDALRPCTGLSPLPTQIEGHDT